MYGLYQFPSRGHTLLQGGVSPRGHPLFGPVWPIRRGLSPLPPLPLKRDASLPGKSTSDVMGSSTSPEDAGKRQLPPAVPPSRFPIDASCPNNHRNR